MRKIIFAYSLLLFLTACKNEEKSKLIDNSNIKNTQKNKNQTQISTSDKNSSSKIIETGIYQDKDSLYHLKYNLEVGKTYSFNSKEINKQTITFRGKSQSMTQETYDPINFKVTDNKDNKYTLEVKLGGKKIITKAEGKEFTFDTQGKQPTDLNQARMWKIYKAISEVSFTVDMDVFGNLSNIKGLDAIYTKAKNSLSGDLKGKQLDDFVLAFKKGFNAETFKTQFENSMMKFPAKGLKIGEKWNNDPSRKNQGFNQLIQVNDQSAEVKVQGIIPSKSDSKVIDGVTYKISVKGSQNGKIIMNKNSGWISNASFNITVTETRSAKKGNESEQVIQKTENNTYIN